MSDVKKCPYCAEEILAEAVKCRFCGEFLDAALRAERTPPHPVPAQQWKPGIAALLSLLIVGAGQMYKGQVGTGLIMFVGAAILYGAGLTSDDSAIQLLALIGAVMIHGASVWHAYSAPLNDVYCVEERA